MPRIGIDLGGTKIEGIVLQNNGEISHRLRIATPSGDYAGTLQAICKLVFQLEQEAEETCSIGIGTPGATSPQSGLLRNSNSVCLNGQPVRHDLESQLQRPIRMANDADCFALSEASDGAGSGTRSVFGVIVGTGTGGGLVYNGQLIQGPNAIAGEWGHNPLPWPELHELPGPACYCGKYGCIETWLSGPGLTRDFADNNDITAREIVALAEEGDAKAEDCLQRYERRMAKALASIINVYDPEVIVLGGGLSQIDRLYTNVPRVWGEYVFSDAVITKLKPPVHGDSSGVRGAAWLWPEDKT